MMISPEGHVIPEIGNDGDDFDRDEELVEAGVLRRRGTHEIMGVTAEEATQLSPEDFMQILQQGVANILYEQSKRERE